MNSKNDLPFSTQLKCLPLLVAERISTGVIPNDELKFVELVGIHDRTIFGHEVWPTPLRRIADNAASDVSIAGSSRSRSSSKKSICPRFETRREVGGSLSTARILTYPDVAYSSPWGSGLRWTC